jgi:YVTN family beta-propeller protein
MKKYLIIPLFIIAAINLFSQYNVKTIDFLAKSGQKINSVGPILVASDDTRNLIYVVNTLSSSVSIIDGKTDKVYNISIDGRGFQHLKKECFTFNKRTGKLYLIGYKSLYIIEPKTKSCKTFDTEKQFEAIAVDELSENVFITGRESSKIGFYNSRANKFDLIEWLEHEEELKNLNQTPPPAVRKIVATNDGQKNMIAIDGFSSMIYIVNAETGKVTKSRKIALENNDGRWHLAGYNSKTKQLYLATETKTRKILEAGKIDVFGEKDETINLPDGFTEPVGITYNSKLDEMYITYDNNASIHTVKFETEPIITEIKIPDYGNDATALDEDNDLLYIASWAHGNIEIIDLKEKKFKKHLTNQGIIPHMFAFTFNKGNNSLYYPVGASAVNGAFGSAVNKVNLATDENSKINLGWAPIELIEVPQRKSLLVFNNEDQMAEVKYDGTFNFIDLPYRFPVCAITSPDSNIFLSYGPHQSYWPTVYIWDAKNGILTIDKNDLSFYDRRIPRQAMKMVKDKDGIVYLQQNNWGKEPIFINKIKDDVRNYEIDKRIILQDSVERETTQRVMKYDEKENKIYLVRCGEKDDDLSILNIIDVETQKEFKRLELEKNAVALEFDDNYIYVANYGSNSVSMIDKKTYEVLNIATGKQPLRLGRLNDKVFVLNSGTNEIMEVKHPDINRSLFGFKLPVKATPDNMFVWKEKFVISSFDKDNIYIHSFDPATKKFEKILNQKYSYGEVGYDSGNAAFYIKGVFGDIVFSLTKAKVDINGTLWITDFLSGKLYKIEKK